MRRKIARRGRSCGRNEWFAWLNSQNCIPLHGLRSSSCANCSRSTTRGGRFHGSSPSRREFGFGGWEKKIEFRHIRVKNEEELRARLVSEAPLYVSHSVGYYEFPDARPMARKNWLCADLVFDLDAEGHSCGKFTCGKCLDKVKGDAHQAHRGVPAADFGFSKQEISVNFSGSRGYHVHVRSESVVPLDREARREIADYVTGTGLTFDRPFLEGREEVLRPARLRRADTGASSRGHSSGSLSEEDFALSISRKLKKPEEKAKLIAAISRGATGTT